VATFVGMQGIETLLSLREKARQGGGEKALIRLKSQGKWSARERVDYLLDNPAEAIEIGLLAGEGCMRRWVAALPAA
jgi:3-methylcrotonyl-CoA carboxylase beta subunit